ncbi:MULTISPECIES: hypothetical protein [Okeania]|uniref:Uncharacterized protein n=1 Tax=Okeania hirsuta TaxID=1458930 RepID=A0A3N6R135_9CYAN|nr:MULTISPECIES: hypothetical protein [Okeania]NET13354.1 hypothetical protein [Okeania sp. SIO1H6]NEP87843.1 hypothetical protein [Okeania sp. SIO2C2]NES77047.1 hypothetical protein [Okeania sp. SIO1H4]NES89383.1 hypothetical protein [Okeania sp. SIO2B9]NET18542.1 hypothetical protein [Okeania sp. SIO1H5]
MYKDVQTIFNSIPNEVAWQNIVQFEQLDDRVAIANDFYPNMVGVNDGFIEWCPNDEPPSYLERLMWWWVVRPDMGVAFALEDPVELKRIIGNYILINE